MVTSASGAAAGEDAAATCSAMLEYEITKSSFPCGLWHW